MTRSITIACLSILLALPVANTAIAQARTGTGGGPTSTVTAPNTSSVGRVMPPSRGTGAATEDERRVRTPREAENDPVMRGICIGCDAK